MQELSKEMSEFKKEYMQQFCERTKDYIIKNRDDQKLMKN